MQAMTDRNVPVAGFIKRRRRHKMNRMRLGLVGTAARDILREAHLRCDKPHVYQKTLVQSTDTIKVFLRLFPILS